MQVRQKSYAGETIALKSLQQGLHKNNPAMFCHVDTDQLTIAM